MRKRHHDSGLNETEIDAVCRTYAERMGAHPALCQIPIEDRVAMLKAGLDEGTYSIERHPGVDSWKLVLATEH